MTAETLATVFKVGQGDGASTASGSDTFDTIGLVTDSSGGGYAANAINTTVLASTTGEFKPGRPVAKPVTINLITDIDDAGQARVEAAILGRIVKNVQITHTASSDVEDYKAVITEFDPGEVGDDDVRRGSITLQPSGAITRS